MRVPAPDGSRDECLGSESVPMAHIGANKARMDVPPRPGALVVYPAMDGEIADRVWTPHELVGLLIFENRL